MLVHLYHIFITQALWEVVCIDAFLPDDRRRRYDVIHGDAQIGLPFSHLTLYHHFGGQIPDTHFMCKIPAQLSSTADEGSAGVMSLSTMPEVLSVYETVKRSSRPKAMAQMARALEKRWSVITSMSPAVARGILRDVAGYDIIGYQQHAQQQRAEIGDGATQRRLPARLEERTLDERLMAILDTQDPSIIMDGRSMVKEGERGRTKFDDFWSAVEQVLVSSDAAIVDERRHNEDAGGGVVLQRSANVSFRDIYERAVRLAGEGAAIPSQRWMEFQFWPKDASLRSSVNYTGRMKVTMAAQSAQLRKFHPDQIVGHVEFKYLKHLAVLKRIHTDMLCGDDKHKVNVGEVGFPVGAAVKTRRVVVGEGEVLAKADHDFSRFNLIPSVTLKVDIPESVDESFYTGQTTVTIKDAITQPSSAVRHVAESMFAAPEPSKGYYYLFALLLLCTIEAAIYSSIVMLLTT